MTPLDLIETARGEMELGSRRPTQASLRRATSTAYYALFHCLASSAANLLIGRIRSPAWHRVHRALEHGRARSACHHEQVKGFPTEIRNFAKTFLTLQRARQQADYALDSSTFYKSDVLVDIASAESAIEQFQQVDVDARREFAAQVLFRERATQSATGGPR